MTWKENTFWDQHPQSFPLPAWSEKAPRIREGLRVKPQRGISDPSNSAVLFQVGICGFIMLNLKPFMPNPENAVVMMLFFPAAILALAFSSAIISARYYRFYLFDAVTGRFVSRSPLYRYDLLVRVASDPELLAHLGETRWGRRCPGLAWRIPCGRSILGMSFIILLFILSFPLFFTVSAVWWGTMTLIAGSFGLMVMMYRRAAPSRPRGFVEDWTFPPQDPLHIPFERVRTATLHWDRLLQREYLMLEHDSGHLRYYNFTGDPLYLLRLWKLRMPVARLQLSHLPG